MIWCPHFRCISITLYSTLCVITLILRSIDCDKGPNIIVLGGSGSNSGGGPSIIQTDGGGGGSSGGFLSGLTSSFGVGGGGGNSASNNNNAQSNTSPLSPSGHPNVLVLGSDSSSGGRKGSNKKSNVIIIMQPPASQQQQQQQQQNQQSSGSHQQNLFSPEMMYQQQGMPPFQTAMTSYGPQITPMGHPFHMPQYGFASQQAIPSPQHQYYTGDGSTLTRRGGSGQSSFFPQPQSELMASGSTAHPFADSESLMKLLHAYGNAGSSPSPSTFSPSFACPPSYSNYLGYRMMKAAGAGSSMYPLGSNSHSKHYPWPGMVEQYNSQNNPFSSTSSSPSSLLSSSSLSTSLPSSILTHPSFLHHSNSPSGSSSSNLPESPSSSDLSELLSSYSHGIN